MADIFDDLRDRLPGRKRQRNWPKAAATAAAVAGIAALAWRKRRNGNS